MTVLAISARPYPPVKIADFGLSNVMRDGHFLKVGPGQDGSPRHPTHLEPSSIELNETTPYDVASHVRRALAPSSNAP